MAYHHPTKPWSFEGYTWWKILSRDRIQYRLYVIVYVFVYIVSALQSLNTYYVYCLYNV